MILPPFLTLLTIQTGFDTEFVARRGGKRSCFDAALLHKASFHTIITLKEATFFRLLLLSSAARWTQAISEALFPHAPTKTLLTWGALFRLHTYPEFPSNSDNILLFSSIALLSSEFRLFSFYFVLFFLHELLSIISVHYSHFRFEY